MAHLENLNRKRKKVVYVGVEGESACMPLIVGIDLRRAMEIPYLGVHARRIAYRSKSDTARTVVTRQFFMDFLENLGEQVIDYEQLEEEEECNQIIADLFFAGQMELKWNPETEKLMLKPTMILDISGVTDWSEPLLALDRFVADMSH